MNGGWRSAASDLIGQFRERAGSGHFVDELLGALDLISRVQQAELLAKMRLRLHGRVPAAVAIEIAARRPDIRQQVLDLDLCGRRRGGRAHGRVADAQGEDPRAEDREWAMSRWPRRRGAPHSSLSAGTNVRNRNLNRCHQLRAGSLVNSIA